jgi:hypothetical protein
MLKSKRKTASAISRDENTIKIAFASITRSKKKRKYLKKGKIL